MVTASTLVAEQHGPAQPSSYMPSAFAKLVCAVGLIAIATSMAGCQSHAWTSVAKWNPMSHDDDSPGYVTPAERIAAIEERARASKDAPPEEQQRVVVELATQLRAETNPLLRIHVVRAIAGIPHPAAADVLIGSLADPDGEVRAACCRALADHPGPRTTATLVAALSSDTSIDVRLAAADVLGQIDDPQAVAALGLALEDRDPALQYRAMQSLKSSTGENYGNDVNAWLAYVHGGTPEPVRLSLYERIRSVF